MKSRSDSTILLVDDEEDLLEAMSFDFGRQGYHVLTAKNGLEATAIMGQKKIDLVVSDVRMPGGNGIELLDSIKKSNVFLPVVMFVTAFSDMSLEEAYDRGVEAVFSKPFDREALFAAVERVLQPVDERYCRKDNRITTENEIDVKLLHSNKSIEAKVKNIGRGGVFIATGEPSIKISDHVKFTLEGQVLNGNRISGSGTVRWIRKIAKESLPPGFGLEFMELDPGCRAQVVELINFCKTTSYIPKS